MFEPTESRVDADVQRSMEMFERAKVGEVAPIEPRVPKKLLVVLDGSSQDFMSLSISDALRRRFGPTIDVLDGREGVSSSDLAVQAAGSLQAHAMDKLPGDNYEQILMAMDRSGCELAVVPSPFERDLDKVGSDSTGTVIDVLLARSPVPILVVRRSYSLEHTPFDRVRLVVIGRNGAAPVAARWTVGMIAPQGSIELLLVLEEEVLRNVQTLMRSLDPNAEITPDVLGDALEQWHVRLHVGMQRAAKQLGVRYRLDVRRESEAQSAEEASDTPSPLFVLAHDRANHGSQARVHDWIRHSLDPVLVAAGD